MITKPENMQNKTPIKIFNRYFALVTLLNLILVTMNVMFNATISLHIDSKGYPAALAGTATSIGAIVAVIYRFFGGKLCDLFGRRNLLAIGFLMFAIGSMLLGIADGIGVLLALRVLQMIGFSITSTSISVAVVDIVPKERLGEGIGYYGLSNSVAQAIAPSVGLALFATSGAFTSVMAFACLSGIAASIIVIAFFKYEKDIGFHGNRINADKKEKMSKVNISERGVWKFIEKKAIPALVVNSFIYFVVALIMLFLTLYASRERIANAGLFFTISVISMIVARLFAGRISDRFGTIAAVLPGSLLLASGFVLLILSGNIKILYYISGVCYGLGVGISDPALNAAAVKAAGADRRSIASSTFMMSVDIGFILAPVLWGALIDVMPFAFVFAIAGGISIMAAILSVVIFGRKTENQPHH